MAKTAKEFPDLALNIRLMWHH